MASMHGFTIKITGQDGKPETVLFSSCRKTPEMLGILKQVVSRQREFDRLVMTRTVLRTRVQAISSGDAGEGPSDPFADDTAYMALQKKVSDAIGELETNDDRIDAINAELCDLMWSFYKKGFLGAGYPEEKAEEVATLLDPSDFPTLRDRAMTGCGAVDFTKRDTR